MKGKIFSILCSVFALTGLFGTLFAFAEELDIAAPEAVTSVVSTGDHLFTIVAAVAAVAVIVLVVFTLLGKKH